MVGIDAKNKNVLDPKFICPKCFLILQDPKQLTTCEHRLCRSCVDMQYGTTIRCPECFKETQGREVKDDLSFQSTMQSLPIECSLCDWNGTLGERQNHINDVHSNLNCNDCSENFRSMNKLNKHRVLDCQKNTVDCLLKDFGCKEPIVLYNINNHYDSDRHQEVSTKCLQQIQLEMNAEHSQSTSVVILDPDTHCFREFCEYLGISFDKKKFSTNDDQRCFNNILLQFQKKFPTRKQDFFRTALSVEETERLSDEGMTNMPSSSNDGLFFWRIPNLNQKISDAQSERQTSIYSAPFYSSSTGYKMRARLYLHGDGNARRTHMSLFFVLMRGPNDLFLKFPFNYKVTFCLYDQTGAQRHIIDSFRPDIRSNSFQRPRSDMNIASGIPKFFPLEMIEQEGHPYVRDDTMFIKVMVDFADVPKTVLPYAMSINPGIPTNIQQRMIQEEAARQSQEANANN